MDIKDSYLHGTVGVVKSISVDADKLKYKLADIAGTIREVTLPLVTTTANGLMSSADKKKLDAFNLGSLKNNLVLKINSGTTEGTNLYTYNGSAAKTLDIKNGAGIGFTNTAGSLQIYNSGVRAIATGTTNGTISVNTNGTSKDVAVKGLGSAAYTPSTNYLNLKTYVSPSSEGWVYKKITVTKNVTDGYGIWLHSRKQQFLANSGCSSGTSYYLLFYELGTNLNPYLNSGLRTISIKMVATYSSSNVTFYVKIDGYNYLQVVSSGIITILDSTQSEYDGITSSTQGWVPCTYAKWTDTTYTFKNGTSGNFTVTPLGGTAQTISVGKPATSGTADIAVKLQTKRKLWGLDFDGTTNVSGDMTGVGNITIPSSNKDKYITFDTGSTRCWRLGYTGSGSGEANYLIFQSTKTASAADGWYDALKFGCETLTATFGGNVIAPTFQGNLDGTYVNKLTNYTIATAIGSIAATDSLNTALGKLEFKTNFIYNDLFGTDNDDVINKWHEIVDFIDSVKEGTDITDEFVTRKTALTITGAKSFSTVVNITGASNFAEGIRLHHLGGLSSLWFGAVNNSGYDPGMWGISVDTNGMRFRGTSSTTGTSPFDYVNIIHGGNVGIGTVSPACKLHVVGDIFTTTGFKKNGSSDSYVLLGGGGHKALSDFLPSGNYAGSDTSGGKAYYSYKLYYANTSHINTKATLDDFLEPYIFKARLWNGNNAEDLLGTSFPGTGNGIILSGGWSSATYGFLLAIDDDPNYFIALRLRGNGNWYSWKRIPMGDGTGASGTWNINISGNASTASRLKPIIVVDSKAFSLSNASWTDTGYTFASLATGTYAVQVTFGTTLVASGIMSVYNNLSDTAGDEIPLHVYGTAGWRPYLRTYANKLLISSNDISATSRTITIKIALIL